MQRLRYNSNNASYKYARAVIGKVGVVDGKKSGTGIELKVRDGDIFLKFECKFSIKNTTNYRFIYLCN
jgi:hypothetical protein